MAMFIRIDVDQGVVRKTEGLAQKLVGVCPVKIFAQGTDPKSVAVVEENVDECTLCEMCIKASPDGVKVVKLYDKK
jgi:NAD-dependent dihydropyrimidine dehydrogenase PreA subunit